MTNSQDPRPSPDLNGSTSSPSWRWGKLALVVSLALNVALVGMLIGGAMRGASHRSGEPGIQPDFRTLWHVLPETARAELRRQRDEFRPNRQGREERRTRAIARNREIVGLLRQDPFDAAAFEELLTRERQTLERRLQHLRHGFVEQVSAMSPQQRLTMAEELEARWREHGRYERASQ